MQTSGGLDSQKSLGCRPESAPRQLSDLRQATKAFLDAVFPQEAVVRIRHVDPKTMLRLTTGRWGLGTVP